VSVLADRRWWALGALSAAMVVVGLDLTILNVALPTLSRELHASSGQLQWFADSYNLVLAAVLLPAGLLGDRFGPKRLLVAALAVFGVSSAACAYSGSSSGLIAARAGLGLGAAFLLPLGMSVLTTLFPGAERRRAISTLVTANMIGIPLGPIVGGWLLDHFWWGSVFLINVPMIAIAIVAVTILMPDTPGTANLRIDVAGVVTSSVALVALTYGVIQAGEKGWGSTTTIATLGAGAVAITAFIGWQRRYSHPLVDLALFRSRAFTGGSVLATIATFTLFGILFTMPQFFQAVGGADALGTGLRLLPILGGMVVGTRLSSRLARTVDARALITIGFALVAAAMFVGTVTGPGTSYAFVGGWMGVAGAGLGFALPAAMDTSLGALDPTRAGTGSAVIMAMRQVGGTIGVAILGTVANSAYRANLDVTGLPAAASAAARRSVTAGTEIAQRSGSGVLLESVRSSFSDAVGAVLTVSGVLAAAGIPLALWMMPRRAPGTAIPGDLGGPGDVLGGSVDDPSDRPADGLAPRAGDGEPGGVPLPVQAGPRGEVGSAPGQTPRFDHEQRLAFE
jgi:EmrB/QacA subfamily drug resistance transporter